MRKAEAFECCSPKNCPASCLHFKILAYGKLQFCYASKECNCPFRKPITITITKRVVKKVGAK